MPIASLRICLLSLTYLSAIRRLIHEHLLVPGRSVCGASHLDALIWYGDGFHQIVSEAAG